jgi:heme a synthase
MKMMPDPGVRGSIRARGPIRLWIACLAALVFAMVVVGGATRLTQSGLSIVEWRPVTGVVPPLSQAEWQAEFDKYKTIPQYQRVNRGMSLDEFKTIFWWEWSHRLLGRALGVVFLLPFLFFLWRGVIDRRLAGALIGIFALGAVQGVVGWWMVSSGLTERVVVSQYRLAFHLTLACLIYAALVVTADRYASQAPAAPVPRRIAFTAAALAGLVIAQIYLGALVAGLHAGLIYNTWPLIDGALVPPVSGLLFDQPAWRNFFENPLTVQFDHRMVAYGLFAVALFHVVDAWRSVEGRTLRIGATVLAAIVCAQVALGIVTLIAAAPLALAMLHQAMALLVLTVATLHASHALAWPAPLPARQLASGY